MDCSGTRCSPSGEGRHCREERAQEPLNAVAMVQAGLCENATLVDVLEEWMARLAMASVECWSEVCGKCLLNGLPFGAASDGWSIASRGNHKLDWCIHRSANMLLLESFQSYRFSLSAIYALAFMGSRDDATPRPLLLFSFLTSLFTSSLLSLCFVLFVNLLNHYMKISR